MVYTITVHLTAKSDPECIRKLKNKLLEASRVYSKDKETVSTLSPLNGWGGLVSCLTLMALRSPGL
jgi:hypothetical protein